MSSYRKTSVLAAIAALAAFSIFTSAAEAAPLTRSVVVNYRLDPSNAGAIDALYRQIATAAKRACRSYDAHNLRERDEWRRCRDEAVSGAIARFVETRIATLKDKADLGAVDVPLIAARL